MKIAHECIYVKCTKCYKPPGRQNKRCRTGNKVSKRSSKSCNHKVLYPLFDYSYYKKPYLSKMEDEEYFPSVCITCDRHIKFFPCV